MFHLKNLPVWERPVRFLSPITMLACGVHFYGKSAGWAILTVGAVTLVTAVLGFSPGFVLARRRLTSRAAAATMPSALPDGLVDAARAGDESALLHLLVACRPDLTWYARCACESDDVEEAVQDALWLLYRRVGGLRAGTALSAWMSQVVRRLCLRFTRRCAARDRFASTPLADDLPGAAAEDERPLELVRAIGELPPSYRDVLMLRHIGGFEVSEVAAQLGITVEAVRGRLHRARGLMREMLRPGITRPSASRGPAAISFGNRTIALHVVRGAIGFGALALAVTSASQWLSVGLIPIGLIALKGRPICRTIGLVETIVMRVHGRHGADGTAASAAPPGEPALQSSDLTREVA